MGASRTVTGLEESIEYGQSGTKHVAVTYEALQELADIEPSLAIMDGVPDVIPCLQMLGFRIDRNETTSGKVRLGGWSTLKDTYVRCGHDKTKAMKTTVYGGTLRSDYKHRSMYGDTGVYVGTGKYELDNNTLISIDQFNDAYRKMSGDGGNDAKNFHSVEHALHCDLGGSGYV